MSAGLDFETKIMVKERAPQLLRAELHRPKWTPQVLLMSGVTDPYQPVEKRLRITRRVDRDRSPQIIDLHLEDGQILAQDVTLP